MFLGQILTGKITLMPEERSQISAHDLLPIAEKLRAQILFITFFYSKIDVLEDFDDIFDLNNCEHFKKAESLYYGVYGESFSPDDSNDSSVDDFTSYDSDFGGSTEGSLHEKYFKMIEAYCCLASIQDSADTVINKLLNYENVKFIGEKLVLGYYHAALVVMHQLSLHMTELEHVFLNRFTDMILDRDKIYISKRLFYKIIKFFETILDRIIEENLDLFLYLGVAKTRLDTVAFVFSKSNLYPNINWSGFRRNFRRICNTERGESYENVLNEILCDI